MACFLVAVLKQLVLHLWYIHCWSHWVIRHTVQYYTTMRIVFPCCEGVPVRSVRHDTGMPRGTYTNIECYVFHSSITHTTSHAGFWHWRLRFQILRRKYRHSGRKLMNARDLRFELNPQSRVFLDKLIVLHLVKKFPAIYENPNLLLCQQQPATCPFHVPDQSTPSSILYLRSVLTFFVYLCLGL